MLTAILFSKVCPLSIYFSVLELEFNVSIAVATSALKHLITSIKTPSYFLTYFLPALSRISETRLHIYYSEFLNHNRPHLVHLGHVTDLHCHNFQAPKLFGFLHFALPFFFLYPLHICTNKHTVYNVRTLRLSMIQATWCTPCGLEC